MKRVILMAVMAIVWLINAQAAESHVIEFNIRDGGSSLSNSTLRKMESNVVNLMTMMSDAQAKGSNSLNFSGIPITESAKKTILKMWKYQPLRVWADDQDVVPLVNENLLNLVAVNGYQVRNIPVRLFPKDAPGTNKYSEVSINFSPDGTIQDFNITIERNQYEKIIQEANTVQDLENRKMLAYWMDQLKMAYESHDLDYLMSLFDKDAIIITGVRKFKKAGREAQFKTVETFDYYVKNVDQYRSSMRQVFSNNKDIRVNFVDQVYGCNDAMLIPGPDGDPMPRYYTVWCTQEWNATKYSDVGRLFVLWDFKNPDQPTILVRAWTSPDDPKQFSTDDFDLNN